MGNLWNSATNIAQYPTDQAFGFEIEKSTGDTNRIRLIAHNGSTNTNGPWVNAGTIFQNILISVKQNKTNGEIQLYLGINSPTASIVTNATIFGGPTNSAPNQKDAVDIGLFRTNTNSTGSYFSASRVWVEVTD